MLHLLVFPIRAHLSNLFCRAIMTDHNEPGREGRRERAHITTYQELLPFLIALVRVLEAAFERGLLARRPAVQNRESDLSEESTNDTDSETDSASEQN